MDQPESSSSNTEVPGSEAQEPAACEAGEDSDTPATRKFCPICGAAWQPSWLCCPTCQSVSAPSPSASKAQDRSHMTTALALYFMLLAASGITLIIGVTRAGEASDIIRLEIADAVIISLFALATYRTVLAGLTRRVNIAWFFAAIGAALTMFLIASGMLALEHRFLGVRELHMVRPFLAAGFGWTTIILANCVQPAVFEELGFRGIILPSLQSTLSPRDAVIVSALLFMTLHLTVAAFPYLFLLGLVLGYLRVRTGSMLPGMLLHFTYNLLCILIIHF